MPYRVRSEQIQYKGHSIACGICYSPSIKEQKEKSQRKKIAKERESLETKLNPFQKRTFACEEDAQLEIEKLSKDIRKLKFHQVGFEIQAVTKRKPGRPAKNQTPSLVYQLVPCVTEDEKAIESHLIKECTFILASNQTSFTATELLQEYKTQSQTEKKFQQLKSPHFVNAMFLDSPRRIEAFAYLMLMVILLLSVAEYVVPAENITVQFKDSLKRVTATKGGASMRPGRLVKAKQTALCRLPLAFGSLNFAYWIEIFAQNQFSRIIW